MRQKQGSEHLRGEPVRDGMAWVMMLVWIALAFVIAGLVAYRLVAPFFHHG